MRRMKPRRAPRAEEEVPAAESSLAPPSSALKAERVARSVESSLAPQVSAAADAERCCPVAEGEVTLSEPQPLRQGPLGGVWLVAAEAPF